MAGFRPPYERHDGDVVTSPLLSGVGIAHGFFTRMGGVSKGDFRSLNVGYGCGDKPEYIRENRRRAAAFLNLDADALILPNQCHGAVTASIDHRPDAPPDADGIVSANPKMMIGVVTADCAPLLLAEPSSGLVAAVHIGWRGAISGMVASSLAMMEKKGARRARIIAALGPMIAASSYPVSGDLYRRFTSRDPSFSAFFSPVDPVADRRDGENAWFFDLGGLILGQLDAGGIRSIDDRRINTFTDSGFFSHRRSVRSNSGCGRQLSAIRRL